MLILNFFRRQVKKVAQNARIVVSLGMTNYDNLSAIELQVKDLKRITRELDKLERLDGWSDYQLERVFRLTQEANTIRRVLETRIQGLYYV